MTGGKCRATGSGATCGPNSVSEAFCVTNPGLERCARNLCKLTHSYAICANSARELPVKAFTARPGGCDIGCTLSVCCIPLSSLVLPHFRPSRPYRVNSCRRGAYAYWDISSLRIKRNRTNWAAGTAPAPFQTCEVMRRQPQAIGGTLVVKERASQYRRRGARWEKMDAHIVGILNF
jgi:hypothetical protein